MIARTVTVEARITDRIIEAQASFSTKIRHYSTDYDDYDGAYEVDPDWEAQKLETKDKIMHDDVTVKAIYISTVENLSGGNTVYIGGEIDYA